MEFLGDAVIELVSSHVLYENFPDKEEGPLTEARSALVKGSNLAKLAQKLGFEPTVYIPYYRLND